VSVRIEVAKRRIITEDGAHSHVGFSSSKRWLNCPGSVRATRGMPGSSSEYADEGTAAHAVTEYCRHHDVPAIHFIGWTVEVHRDGAVRKFPCDQEMVDSCQEFIDYCNEVPSDHVLIEETLSIEEYVPGGFGTLDDARLQIAEHCAVITDFKHGKGVQVWAEQNEQLMCQALSVYLEWDWLYGFKKFVLRIAQPRLGHFDSWEIDVEDLLNWAGLVLDPGAHYALSDDGATKFAAGSWCQFCKIKASCETRAVWSLSQVVQTPPDEFEDLDAAVKAAETEIVEFPVGTGNERMSNEQLSKCLAVVDLVASWCKDVKALSMRFLQQGFPVGDWKLVEGRSKRKWNLPEEYTAKALKEEGGIDPYEHKLLTPPKAEKLIGKKHPIMTARDEEGNLIYVSKPPGKPKLAPGHDKRPAMSIDLLQEFGDLGAEEEKDDDD